MQDAIQNNSMARPEPDGVAPRLCHVLDHMGDSAHL